MNHNYTNDVLIATAPLTGIRELLVHTLDKPNILKMLRSITTAANQLLAITLAVVIFGGEAWHLLPGMGHSGNCCWHACEGPTHSHGNKAHAHVGGCSHHRHVEITVTDDSRDSLPNGQIKSLQHTCAICKVLALRGLPVQVHLELSQADYIACLCVDEPIQRAREIEMASAPRGPPAV
jgi:hypothetical protein